MHIREDVSVASVSAASGKKRTSREMKSIERNVSAVQRSAATWKRWRKGPADECRVRCITSIKRDECERIGPLSETLE